MKVPTYEEQLRMVELGYAKKSTNGIFDTFKYSRKVMYNYLWNELESKGILECRGHTYDNRNGNIVTLPLTKSFNYLELDTWKDLPLDTQVAAFKKYNGFMVAATRYQGDGMCLDVGIDNAYNIFGEHRLFSSDDIAAIMKGKSIVIKDNHRKNMYS